MTSTQDASTTRSDRIHRDVLQLRNGVAKAVKEWSTVKATDTGAVANPFSSCLHPFGPVDVEAVRHDFDAGLRRIRESVLSARQRMAQASPSEVSVRKLQNLMKEGTGLDESNYLIKEQLDNCRTLLRKETEIVDAGADTTSEQLLEKLEIIAKNLKLEAFKDTAVRQDSSTVIDTLMMGGKVMVIDIDIEKGGTSSKVKVSYTTDRNQDDQLDGLLTDLLKKRNLIQLTKHLSTLARIDELTSKNSPLDFFTILRQLHTSWKVVADQYSSQEALLSVGLPLYNVERPFSTIAFWANSQEMLSRSDFDITKLADPANLLSFRIEVLESIAPTHFFVDERLNYISKEAAPEELQNLVKTESSPFDGITYFRPNAENLSANLSFIAIFDQPIPMWSVLANSLVSSAKDTPHDTLNDMETLEYHLASDNSSSFNVYSHYRASLAGVKPSLIFNYGLPRPVLQMITLSRILFTHPSTLFPMLPVIRRQLVFNELFQSVFNTSMLLQFEQPSGEIDLDDLLSSPLEDVHIDVTPISTNYKFGMSITFVNPYKVTYPSFEVSDGSQVISLELLVAENSEPTITIYGSHDAMIANAKLSNVAKRTRDIPCIVGWILKALGQKQDELIKPEPEQEAEIKSEPLLEPVAPPPPSTRGRKKKAPSVDVEMQEESTIDEGRRSNKRKAPSVEMQEESTSEAESKRSVTPKRRSVTPTARKRGARGRKKDTSEGDSADDAEPTTTRRTRARR